MSTRCYNCLDVTAKVVKCPKCSFDNTKIPNNPSALTPGTVLDDRYFIGRVLGQGGFGITYVSYDEILGQIVALKEHYPKAIVQRNQKTLDVIAQNLSEFNDGLRKFTDEAKSLAKFQGHKNIVSVLSYMRTKKTAYMVMEYIEGRTVKEILQGAKSLPVKDSIEIILEVLEGLGACHAQKLIHRDLTPDNIYITTKGSVKILDFGSARVTQDGGDNEFTQILKKSYAPIEQFQQGSSQGPWTDIYSVGATFYRLVTGQPPALNSVDRLLNDTLKKPSEFKKVSGWNEDLEATLMKALSVRPEQRYQEIDSFKVDLLNASLSSGAKIASISSTATKSPKPVSPKKVASKPAKKTSTTTPSKTSQTANSKPLVFGGAAVAVIALVVGLNVMDSEDYSTNVGGGSVAQQGSQSSSSPETRKQVPPRPAYEKDIPPKNKQPKKTVPPIQRKIEKDRTNRLQNQTYSLTVNTDNGAVIKVYNKKDLTLVLRDRSSLSMGDYVVKVWKKGYRLSKQEINLKQDKRISVDLKRFVTPSQRAQEKFYEIYQSPTSSAIAQFKNSYPTFETLAQLGPILMGDKKIRNDMIQNAEIGDAESNLLIGLIYSKPNTLPYIKTNLSTAKNYFKKASDEGYTLGSVFYAQALSCTITRSGCNKLRSERLFKDSDLELGNFLQAELLVKSGKADAASRLLKKSSLSGSSFGMNLLGEIEYKKGNIQKSLDYFLIAANQGNTPATISLAAIDPSSRNIKKLKSFYYLGSKEAGISLALSIQESDPKGFFDLSKELAKSAPEDGNLLLAIAYLNGSGTKVSAVNAAASLKKCASNTNCKILSTISSSDSDSVKSKNLKSLTASVESDSASANVIPSILGSAYSMLGQIELKAGKPKSSISFFENGARLNDIDSMISLCDIYLYNNSQRNVKNARTYCMQAYNQGTKNPFVLNTLGSLALGTWGEKYEKSSALKYFKESCSLNSGIGCCNSALTSTKTNDKTSFIKKAKKYGYQCDL